MLTERIRWLIGGVSVLLPAILFVFGWALVMMAPGLRLPTVLFYFAFGAALSISTWIIMTCPVTPPRRLLLLSGAWSLVAVQFVLLMWIATQFSRLLMVQ
jgi:hypothetical protein